MIANVQLGTSETTICLAGASETRALLVMLFCNTDTSTRSITVYAYPTGSSAGASTTIIYQYSIPAGDTFQWTSNEKFLLGPSDKVSGIADVASKVTVTSTYMVL